TFCCSMYNARVVFIQNFSGPDFGTRIEKIKTVNITEKGDDKHFAVKSLAVQRSPEDDAIDQITLIIGIARKLRVATITNNGPFFKDYPTGHSISAVAAPGEFSIVTAGSDKKIRFYDTRMGMGGGEGKSAKE